MFQDIWSWGSNHGFTLMLTEKESQNVATPTQVTDLNETPIKQISSGHNYTVVLTQEGNVIEYSCNERKKRTLELQNVKKLSSGFGFYACLTTNGELYLSNFIVDIVCGSSHLILLTQLGNVYGFGESSSGQISANSRVETLALITSNTKKIFSGNYSSANFILKKDNTLFALGNNSSGQLGIGSDQTSFTSPVQVENIPEIGKVKHIVVGYQHSIMIVKEKERHYVYSSGTGSYSGHGANLKSFRKISRLENEDVIRADAGCFHTLLLTKSGKLFTFGINPYGPLGTGNFQSYSTPVEVTINDLMFPLEEYKVSAGSFHSFLYSTYVSSLVQDLLQFFERQEGCDITFDTNENPISAHKFDSNHVFKAIYGSKLKLVFEQEIPSCLKRIAKNNDIQEDFEKLYNDENSKDFVLVSDEHRVKVHKLILWMRSELFRGMFLSIQDNSNESPEYSGISFESFQILIYYLYTGKIKLNVEITDSIIEDLAKAMDYFQLNEQEPNLVTKIESYEKLQNTKK
ncbi:btk-binding protein-related [Anaeramoeba ignava]|uniref:Btk-binding protein-related n=1 Tax=Anaeramoeba ignava TaxID=1746090 RepID=A0A9Q0L677_ANAIG|nr:btk-binding protein-related [Anaeramoeba ignava]